MKEKIFLSLKGAMIFSVVVMIALSFVATASATNGYFSHGSAPRIRRWEERADYLDSWQHQPTRPGWFYGNV
jgi:hypothetical protein